VSEVNFIQGIFLNEIFHNSDNSFSIGILLLLEHNATPQQINQATKPIEAFEIPESLGLNKDECPGKVTISGYFPKLTEEQIYRFTGQWIQHPKYGWQFQVASYESVQVKGKPALVHYLSSDLFEGIGKKTAERIVEVLGDEAVNVILNNRESLYEVPRLSKKLADKLFEALVQQQGAEQILAPLYGYNLSPQLVMKIFKRYEYQALQIIEENPYQLMDDIEGIGFIKADEIGQKVGFAPDNPKRIKAALLYVIDQIALQRGHTYVYHQQLLESARHYLNQKTTLQLTEPQIDQEIQELIRLKKIYLEGEFLFIPLLVNSEKGIVEDLRRLQTSTAVEDERIEQAFKQLKKELAITYSAEQEQAIKMALKEPVSIITGGPGTGKTTVVQGILKAYEILHKSTDSQNPIALAAPTGRAAKRMAETTGLKATTIHRLLGYGMEGVFQFDRDTQLKHQLIIIDESSMLDTLLAYQLFQSIATNTQLILVGDDNQLPSVGPGQVLKDLIESDVIPLTRLVKVHRQAEDSSIITLAHAIKQNQLPQDLNIKKKDRLYINCAHGEINAYLKKIILNAIHKGYSYNDIQVLVPMYRGDCGIDQINLMLQEVFNPPDENKRELVFGQKTFRIGDKVLQLSNQPETEIMNGDVGEVIGITHNKENKDKQQKLIVTFDSNEVTYEKGDLIQLTHAYCVSVHKSQGSEYPIVILPITNAYHVMLQKKLIYTAVTRAKKSLIIIGDYQALAKGVKNEGDERQTTLKLRLQMETKTDIKENPFAEYFKEYNIPFDILDEEAMEGITPYDFM